MQAKTAVRVLALVSVALALMCAALAWSWRTEHERAACWRAAVEYKLETDSKCDG